MKLCPRCREPYADDARFCPLDGVELVRDADPFVGRTLAARYRLVRKLGAGGMAVVYLARHVMIERLSAIKILRHDLGLNPAHRERFYREARAVNRINHPNIVEITDFGDDGGLVFLVMEYVDGESLHAVLKRGRLPWQRAVDVAKQVASALARAHELGVIHRDLKPENVLLTARPAGATSEPGGVKLTDFGIAKVADAPTITFHEQRLGTPGFIAPEYIEGEPAGPLCDLYALGVVIYEMLTGTLPFATKSPAELLAATLSNERIAPSARVQGIPAPLEDLVMRLVARNPEDRPRDAFAVHDALGAILRKGSVPASPPDDELVASGDILGPLTTPSAPPESAIESSLGRLTAELVALPTAEISARWHSMLAELLSQVDSACARGALRGDRLRRARELVEHTEDMVAALERAKATAAHHQSRVDRLEMHARSFRASLGYAIDALSRDRSQERVRAEGIAARRMGLERAALAIGPDSTEGDVLLWERAALDTEAGRARASEQDLTFQIAELQKQLDTQNEQVDADLAAASGQLEGALSALRRLTGELVRTVEDAAGVLG
jgi:serine/threonine-protein kinase